MLIRTAKINGLELEAYLRNVIARIGSHPINRRHKLLPWNMPRPATQCGAASAATRQVEDAAVVDGRLRKRNGTANPFMLLAPLVLPEAGKNWGRRHVGVTERRTAIDKAKILRDLADTHFHAADKIVLVRDNLNARTPASPYEAFQPAEARRIIERLE